LAIFITVFALLVLFAVDVFYYDVNKEEWKAKFQFYTTFAFVLGAVTSVVSGYIGMEIATFTNTKVAYTA
jgi:Na+/H+-translocating membrane pyrophosphatase